MMYNSIITREQVALYADFPDATCFVSNEFDDECDSKRLQGFADGTSTRSEVECVMTPCFDDSSAGC